MIKVTPVILCGGSGTRLWPLSRTGFPKQFLCLTGNESLFQQAAQRLAGLNQDGIQVAAPLIVSGEEHRFLATEQLREVGIALGAALLEPVGRNTAPALTLAALAATENGQDPVLVVTPADQTVANSPAFTAAVHQAITQAADGNIVILGVQPDKPETGYGYIHAPLHLKESSDAPIQAFTVQAFVEKPNQATAEGYQCAGELGAPFRYSCRAARWSPWSRAISPNKNRMPMLSMGHHACICWASAMAGMRQAATSWVLNSTL